MKKKILFFGVGMERSMARLKTSFEVFGRERKVEFEVDCYPSKKEDSLDKIPFGYDVYFIHITDIKEKDKICRYADKKLMKEREEIMKNLRESQPKSLLFFVGGDADNGILTKYFDAYLGDYDPCAESLYRDIISGKISKESE